MSAEMIPLLTKALGETVYMVAVSMVISSALGIPLGVLLHVTARGEILDAPAVNRSVGAVVNAIRSIPFIILMVAIIPLTRLIVGSAIGTTAAMVPLVIASVPFIGRQVETSLREVPHGLIEAALSMGATPLQIVTRVLLPESMPGIVSQLTTVVIALVGESAMAGAIGGGGLGGTADLADDLGLANHHGVQARGDGEHLAASGRAGQVGQMQGSRFQARALGKEGGHSLAQAIWCSVDRRGADSGTVRGRSMGVRAVGGGAGQRVEGCRAPGVGPGVGVDQKGQAVAGGQDDDPAQRGDRLQEVRTQPRGDRTQSGDDVEARQSVVGGEKMSSHSERY